MLQKTTNTQSHTPAVPDRTSETIVTKFIKYQPIKEEKINIIKLNKKR